MIQLENISKSFGNIQIIKDISLKVKPGECVSVVGPGGCGKTTLIKILLGLVEPSHGEAYLFDTNMHSTKLSLIEEILRKVGVAFQQGGLFDFLTVRENLTFAMEHMTKKSPLEINQTIIRLLDSVKLSSTEQHYPHELSGGMKRRIGIARAMCTDPKIAFFDEPTAGLDPVTSTIILNMIKNFNNNPHDKIPTTMFVATSNIEIAIRFAERIIVINEGKIVSDGLWKELILNGPEWVKHFLSVRLIGLDIDNAINLKLPEDFLRKHWKEYKA